METLDPLDLRQFLAAGVVRDVHARPERAEGSLLWPEALDSHATELFKPMESFTRLYF
jgi:hypothetical protein